MRDAAHLPFPLRTLSVGLRPVPQSQWLEPVTAEELDARADVFDAHPDMVVWLPESLPAQAELRQMIGAPDVAAGADIERAARHVGEDLCLLATDDLRLVAAAVAYPNRWRPADKLGRPPLGVHEPVPGYPAALGDAVERVIRGLRVDRVVERRNWAVLDDPTLHQPDPAAAMPVAFDLSSLWLRVERQTLRRLPRTGAVCFTIRTRQWRLDELAEVPDQAAGLAEALRSTPEDLAAYKGVHRIRAELIRWLDRLA